MYWGVIDPEGGRSTNNILLQGRLKICDQFIDLLVYEPGASNHKFKFKFFLLVVTNLRAQAEFNPRVFRISRGSGRPGCVGLPQKKSPLTGLPLPSIAAAGSEGHRLLPFHGEWGAHLASTSLPLPWSPGVDLVAASSRSQGESDCLTRSQGESDCLTVG
jgi:hypothetical protein